MCNAFFVFPRLCSRSFLSRGATVAEPALWLQETATKKTSFGEQWTRGSMSEESLRCEGGPW